MPVGLWHPFRHPGLCGLRGTIGILLILCMIIHIVVIIKNARTDGQGNNATEEVSLQGVNQSKRSLTMGMTTAATYHLAIQTTGVFVLTEGRDEMIHCDPVALYCTWGRICPRQFEVSSSVVYVCKDPCAWLDVKAHTATIETYRRGMGLEDRFTVTKDRQVERWMTVFKSSVQSGDSGTYCCALDIEGKDWYQQITNYCSH